MGPPVRQYEGVAGAFRKLYPVESSNMPFREFRRKSENSKIVREVQDIANRDLRTYNAKLKEWKEANPKEAQEFEAAHVVKPRRRCGRRKHIPVEQSRQFKKLKASPEKADLEKLIVKCDQDIQVLKASIIAMYKKLDENIRDCAIIKAKHDRTIKYARELTDTLNVLVASMSSETSQAVNDSDDDVDDDEEEEEEGGGGEEEEEEDEDFD